MRLRKFTASNYLSFKEMEVDLSNQGLTLVLGENTDMEFGSSNGSGKSAIFDSVVWCLFDRTCRGITGDDVVNARVGKDCMVRGEVEVGNKLYIVTRYRKHGKFGNSLKLECDGKDISGVTIRDTQEKLEQLLGMTYKTFVTSCMFGQNLLDLFSRATDKERKEILESVVETKDYSEPLQKARELSKLLSQKISAFESEKTVTVSLLESKEKSALLLEQNIADAAGRAEEQRKAIQKQIDSLMSNLSDCDQLTVALEEAKQLECDAREQRKSSGDVAQEWRDKLADYIKAKNVVDVSVLSLKREIESVKKRLDNFTGLGSACPTCEQQIPHSHRDSIKAGLEEQLSEFVLQYDAALDNQKKIKEECDACNVKIAEANKAEQKLRSDLYDAEQAVKEISDEIAARSRIKKEIELLQSKLSGIASDTKAYEDSLFALRKEIPELKSKLPELEEKIQSASMMVPYADYWEVGFGETGIRSFLFDSCMPVLNDRANYYSKELTSGAIRLEFSSQSALKSGKVRDKISFSAINACGANAYDGNSGGEKRRIDVCVMLALQYLMRHNSKVTCNVLFFDEVFDNLDPEGCVKILELLAMEMQESGLESCFIISHSDHFKSLFLNKIVAKKVNGVSFIEATNAA